MLAGSNPAARTRQSQSPRSPYRGAGRLFCTRFAGSMTSRRHQIMICGSSLPIPPCLFNRLIAICGSTSHISPPPVSFSRAAASDSSIRFAVSHPYSVWRDATSSPSSPFSFPIGGESQLPLLSPLSYPPNRLLAFLLASLSAGRLGVSPTICFPIRSAGRMRIFRAHIFFHVDSASACDTLSDIHAGVVERQTRQI